VLWRVLFLTVLAVNGWQANGFVFYRVAGNILRWNVNNPGMHPDVVNPTTKAVRYYIASDGYSTTNQANEIAAIRAAFDQWQSVPGTSLRFEFAGLLPPDGLDTIFDNRNVVFWAKKSLKVAAGTQDLRNRRAWTSVNFAVDGSIVDADIVLNGIEYQWYTDFKRTNSVYQFVEATVLHEIGHFVGLDHSPAGGATVLNGATGIASEAGLCADEIAAMRFLNPAANQTWAAINGTIRMNGSGILGAMIAVEDAAGNIVGATVSDLTGAYLIPSLAPGDYKLRVSPLASGSSGLVRGEEIAPDYAQAVTGFLPTTNIPVTLAANQTLTRDVNVTSGEPAIRLLGLSKATPDQSAVGFDRTAFSITQGQSNFFTGVVSRGLKPDTMVTVTGDGLTLGANIFLENRFGVGLHAMLVPISVSSNATPGLRSFIVTHPTSGIAYANGYLEVLAATPDFNYDGLSDEFQRTYWSLWTVVEAAPAADPDADFFTNAFEYRTGSNPVDRDSYILRLGPPTVGRFGTTLKWPADLGKRYQLSVRTGLEGGVAWQPAGSPVTATNQTMTVVDGTTGAARFYRLQLVP
jgi:hypothetical protein